jgi:hypothetical protein
MDEIGRRSVKNAQTGVIVIAQWSVGLLCCWSGALNVPGPGA